MTFKPLTCAVTAIILGLSSAPAIAEDAVGTYLAARQAVSDHDFAAAADYFTRALTKDQANPTILEYAVVSHMSLGDIERAIPIARKLEADGLESQIAAMVLMADALLREDHAGVLSRLEDGKGVSPLVDGLVAAWVHIGQGDVSAAMSQFDETAKEDGVRSFAIYQKALALASVGDFESADDIFAGKSDGALQRTRRSTMAWAEVLSQLERNDEAVALIDDAFGGGMDPEIMDLRARLASGERVPFTRISGPASGAAEVYYELGRALLSDTSEDYALVYSRVAEALSPGHVDAVILSAELLDALEQFDLATEAYKRVPRDHPAFSAAEMGRAEALRRADKTDAAIEVLEQLSQSHPEMSMVHLAAGDLYRQEERYDEAVVAYDSALEHYEGREEGQWFIYYSRAISHERIGTWDKAEADFRKALELNPRQPQVLNYLGYSLVEKQIKLDEALDMIELAVARQPNSGYIVDSLGWVLYRLGRYDEAIGHMERAAELMPVDPVVNDHLGDVLWAVGRLTEAEFQWKRALSFVDEENPSPDIDPDRIRRKLEVGLDVVLEEEGAEPLEMVDDDG